MSGSDLNIFDTQFAVNQFSGKKELLLQILEKFINQYQHFDSELMNLLQQSDLGTLKQQVHTLKGVSGNLGMNALHQACKEFEVGIPHQPSDQAVESFLSTFKKTLTLIQEYSTS